MAIGLGCTGLALALSACSSGSALTTGTLLGGSEKKEAPVALVPASPTDRALIAGTTAARAQKCGYVFDPANFRQGYLSYETQQGTPQPELAKAEKSYDYTLASISKSIAPEQNYCTDELTATVKRDLNRMLTGDYSAPAKKPEVNTAWWGRPSSTDKFDRDKAINPQPRN
jgi:hypothetical protein